MRPSLRFPESKIDRFLSQHLTNTQYNRLVWTLYPRLRRLLGRPARGVATVGSEWGGSGEVEQIIDEYIVPYISSSSSVAELGVGGGRLAQLVAPQVGTFVGFDISGSMLREAGTKLDGYPNVRLVKLSRPEFPDEFRESFDFVYSFDVFVHLDLHVMWRYLSGFAEILCPTGRAFIHTSNLAAPGGWEQFASQEGYSVSGHYFVSPEIVGILASRSGFEIVKESTPKATSSYLDRDYLAVLEKSPQAAFLSSRTSR